MLRICGNSFIAQLLLMRRTTCSSSNNFDEIRTACVEMVKIVPRKGSMLTALRALFSSSKLNADRYHLQVVESFSYFSVSCSAITGPEMARMPEFWSGSVQKLNL